VINFTNRNAGSEEMYPVLGICVTATMQAWRMGRVRLEGNGDSIGLPEMPGEQKTVPKAGRGDRWEGHMVDD
jgi:hypothetical protein